MLFCFGILIPAEPLPDGRVQLRVPGTVGGMEQVGVQVPFCASGHGRQIRVKPSSSGSVGALSTLTTLPTPPPHCRAPETNRRVLAPLAPQLEPRGGRWRHGRPRQTHAGSLGAGLVAVPGGEQQQSQMSVSWRRLRRRICCPGPRPGTVATPLPPGLFKPRGPSREACGFSVSAVALASGRVIRK